MSNVLANRTTYRFKQLAKLLGDKAWEFNGKIEHQSERQIRVLLKQPEENEVEIARETPKAKLIIMNIEDEGCITYSFIKAEQDEIAGQIDFVFDANRNLHFKMFDQIMGEETVAKKLWEIFLS